MYRYHRQLLLLRVTGQCHLHRSHRCLRLYFCCPCHYLGLRPGVTLKSRPFFMTIKIKEGHNLIVIHFLRTQQWQLWCPPMLGLVWTTSSTMTTLFGLRPTPRLPTQIGINLDNVDSEGNLIKVLFPNHRFGTSNPINPPNSNVNCVKKMKEKEGQWNDVGCSKQLNYACSMEAVKTCA